MMAPAGVELEMLVSEPDALTTRPPPCAMYMHFSNGVGIGQICNASFRSEVE